MNNDTSDTFQVKHMGNWHLNADSNSWVCALNHYVVMPVGGIAMISCVEMHGTTL
jgi:hypothetical protein